MFALLPIMVSKIKLFSCIEQHAANSQHLKHQNVNLQNYIYCGWRVEIISIKMFILKSVCVFIHFQAFRLINRAISFYSLFTLRHSDFYSNMKHTGIKWIWIFSILVMKISFLFLKDVSKMVFSQKLMTYYTACKEYCTCCKPKLMQLMDLDLPGSELETEDAHTGTFPLSSWNTFWNLISQ